MLILVSMLACKVPPEAPAELDDLTRYLFREWGNDDDAVRTAGMTNLSEFLDGEDLDPDLKVLDRSWELTSIEEADLATIDWPQDRNPADTYGVSVAFRSEWPVTEHAAWQLEDDQLPAEPSAVGYERTYPELDDPSCFADRSCEVLVTENVIERKNLLMALTYTLHKHIRWVELEDGNYALLSRAYIKESTVGESGKSTIWQSYSLDVWLPVGDVTNRYQVLWSEADVAGASDAIQIGTVKASTDDHFNATDEAIAEVQ